MSHVVAVDVQVKDLAALEAAAEGCDLIAVRTKNWVNDYSAEDAAYKNGVSTADYGKCEFALVQRDSPLGQAELAARAAGRRLTHKEAIQIRRNAYGPSWVVAAKPYSVGVIKDPAKEGYTLVYDFFHGGYGLREKIGEGANKLKQFYGASAIESVAAKAGHRLVSRTTLEDGSILIRTQVPSKTKVTVG